jgi:transcriptional regulator with PAS, ATPase and Fis domain
VLLEGRSGTGKELVAKAIHQNSQRNQNPFVAVDCGAIPTNIIESELFGHVKGAFTGANFDRKGLVLEANRGTLFLDEILNLPLDMQAKLLRFLQEGEVRPVGSNLSKKVDVRVITASSIPLKQLVHEQKFREDLYYRLYVYPISISDLTEREEDIPILANAFLYKFAKQQNKTIEKFHETILTYFKERQWEGNIRELENFVERLVTLLPMNVRVINFSNLPEPILEEIKKEKSEVVSENISKALEESVADYEAELIRQALENNHWNKSKAARVLKISEGTIRYKIEKLGISKPQD